MHDFSVRDEVLEWAVSLLFKGPSFDSWAVSGCSCIFVSFVLFVLFVSVCKLPLASILQDITDCTV